MRVVLELKEMLSLVFELYRLRTGNQLLDYDRDIDMVNIYTVKEVSMEDELEEQQASNKKNLIRKEEYQDSFKSKGKDMDAYPSRIKRIRFMSEEMKPLVTKTIQSVIYGIPSQDAQEEEPQVQSRERPSSPGKRVYFKQIYEKYSAKDRDSHRVESSCSENNSTKSPYPRKIKYSGLRKLTFDENGNKDDSFSDNLEDELNLLISIDKKNKKEEKTPAKKELSNSEIKDKIEPENLENIEDIDAHLDEISNRRRRTGISDSQASPTHSKGKRARSLTSKMKKNRLKKNDYSEYFTSKTLYSEMKEMARKKSGFGSVSLKVDIENIYINHPTEVSCLRPNTTELVNEDKSLSSNRLKTGEGKKTNNSITFVTPKSNSSAMSNLKTKNFSSTYKKNSLSQNVHLKKKPNYTESAGNLPFGQPDSDEKTSNKQPRHSSHAHHMMPRIFVDKGYESKKGVKVLDSRLGKADVSSPADDSEINQNKRTYLLDPIQINRENTLLDSIKLKLKIQAKKKVNDSQTDRVYLNHSDYEKSGGMKRKSYRIQDSNISEQQESDFDAIKIFEQPKHNIDMNSNGINGKIISKMAEKDSTNEVKHQFNQKLGIKPVNITQKLDLKSFLNKLQITTDGGVTSKKK